ncbi:MAG: trypsin-like peptidase domain-containing protein [Gemmatimonadaceae bacterium]
MSNRFFRSKALVTGAVAFTAGVLFASSMDFTRYSWAQPSKGSSAQLSARGPNSPDAAGSFANVAERVTPTVVAINTVREARQARPNPRGQQRVPQGMEDFFQQFGGQGGGQPQQQREMRGEGSGFIMSPDGYIITNNHVVADADRVTVTLSDQRTFTAKVVGRDSTTDVAVVKIDAKGLPTLPIGDDNQARIGDWVLAVGNPLGLDFTVTAGIISAKSRGAEIAGRAGMTISDFIQTDAAINPGNSGGPLINLKGEAVGLNSMIASETGYYSGYGFAIPITLVKQVADMLIKEGHVRVPVLGISVGAVGAEDAGINGLSVNSGVLVQGFNPADGGPAKAAGILPGDVVVAIAGQTVNRVSALQRIVRSHAVGETVAVDVMRYGSKKQFKVTLIEGNTPVKMASTETSTPDVAPAPVVKSIGKFGISVEPVPAELSQGLQLPAGIGVRVTEVSGGSPAKDKLFAGSDIITDVLFPGPRRAIRTAAELQALMSGLKDGEYVSLMVTSFDLQTRSKNSRVVNLRAN